MRREGMVVRNTDMGTDQAAHRPPVAGAPSTTGGPQACDPTPPDPPPAGGGAGRARGGGYHPPSRAPPPDGRRHGGPDGLVAPQNPAPRRDLAALEPAPDNLHGVSRLPQSLHPPRPHGRRPGLVEAAAPARFAHGSGVAGPCARAQR